MKFFTFYLFVLYTVKKRALWVLFILCLYGFFFFFFFGSLQFLFLFVNTRYFSNQRKKNVIMKGPNRCGLATGWASCCSHLRASHLTHSRASILRLAAAHPWQGWGRVEGWEIGPCFPPSAYSGPSEQGSDPGQQTMLAHINVTALATA